MPYYIPPRAEVLLALPNPVKPVVKVRSTFVLGSMAGMRESGHFDRYQRALSDAHRSELLGAIPGTWLPVEIAFAHYRACDSLGLAPADVAQRGRAALEKLGGLVYGTAIQMARQAGATPWTFLPSIQRFWGRAYDGGAIAVYKSGPKDARIDLLGCPLCEISYYRSALGGLLEGLVTLFCQKLYLTELKQPSGHESVAYRAQWA